ncbi:SDR family oxidoreductase [Amycolatopsis anabasis]|uniref:SDR family oxidoreductase n=1 Tax=Amycolatopsis anabasis TaxID=1840409 RepID=UPI00131E0768|nr:SDR family oxidoreductase [Amycolatopsis anabasis]
MGRCGFNAVAPGPAESEALNRAGAQGNGDTAADRRGRIPLERGGDLEDVAQWVLALADPASRGVTGQILDVDGGLELI